MRVMIVDNEEPAVNSLVNTVREVITDAEIVTAFDAREALKLAKDCNPDIAFLDIEMPGMDGMTLAKCLKEQVNPRINIIFTTGYNEYVEEAFLSLRASGYLMKPITADMVSEELENLRYPFELKGNNRVRIRAFGTFEIYVDDKPVAFHYNKTKELCAYLTDRAAMCSMTEILDNLWEADDETRDHRSYLQNMVSDLIKTFGDLGVKDLIIKKYGSIGIDPSMADCDYYLYKQGNPAAVNTFRGEYMSQYSWAEKTLGGLVFRKDQNIGK